MVGDKAVDGPIHSISGGSSSTLLAEAKKLATAAGSSKVILSFVGITCPFARAYCFEDLFKAKAGSGVPTLTIYIREVRGLDGAQGALNEPQGALNGHQSSSMMAVTEFLDFGREPNEPLMIIHDHR